jgi:hypothetical protein
MPQSECSSLLSASNASSMTDLAYDVIGEQSIIDSEYFDCIESRPWYKRPGVRRFQALALSLMIDSLPSSISIGSGHPGVCGRSFDRKSASFFGL